MAKKNITETSRLDDMLRRYGEVCSQTRAAFILGISVRTIRRMLADKELDRVGSRVDVRSICRYIENPPSRSNKNDLRGAFFAAAMSGEKPCEP